MNQWTLILGIGVFGGLGTLARYGSTRFAAWITSSGHPWGTFAVNLIGCFLFGILAGLIEAKWISAPWRPILLTGFLGGFTTFSAFAHENYILLQEHRWLAFGGHFIGQTLLGLLAVLVGLYIAGRWTTV